MNAITLAGLTLSMGDQALIAGTTTTLTLSTAKDYYIAGKAYTQATTTNVQPSLLDLNTGVTLEGIPAGYGAALIIGTTSSASTTLRVIQGPLTELEANTAAYTPGAFKVNPQFPSMPDDFCPFGWVTVRVATDYTSGASYIFGSSNTTATGAQNSAATAHANIFTSGNVPDRPVTT